MNTPHYQHGNQTKISVVFSCPGQKEKEAKCPASGKTGENLEVLLKFLLHSKLEKSDLRITNAWTEILYKNNENQIDKNKTEASLKEIIQLDNLNRLKSELKDIEDLIICFGINALNAVKRLELGETNPIVIYCPHLGLQSLNRNKELKTDIQGNPLIKGDKDNSTKRLQKLATLIKTKNPDAHIYFKKD